MAPQDNYVDLPETGGGAGVSSLNGETGNINIVAGSNITVTPSGQSITIASTASGGISGTWSTTGNVVETNGVNAAQDSGKAAAVGPTGSTFALRDSDGNTVFNNSVSSNNTTVSSGQTIAISSASARLQKVTGTQAVTFTMPDATTLTQSGWQYEFNNNSSVAITINDHSNALITLVNPGAYADIICTDNSTSAGTWDVHWLLPVSADWGTSIVVSIPTAALGITIDGGGAVPTTGQKGFIYVPYSCTINSVTMLADQSGSAVVDIWKVAYGSFPPSVANTITASALPTLSSAQNSQDTTLTGWTKTISAGDVLAFNVNSASTLTRINLTLKVTKT